LFLSFANKDNNKRPKNCNCSKKNNNQQRRKTFLDIYCEKISNSLLKQAFNCVLKTNFLTQNIRRTLNNFLIATILAILFLQDIITTKATN